MGSSLLILDQLQSRRNAPSCSQSPGSGNGGISPVSVSIGVATPGCGTGRLAVSTLIPGGVAEASPPLKAKGTAPALGIWLWPPPQAAKQARASEDRNPIGRIFEE